MTSTSATTHTDLPRSYRLSLIVVGLAIPLAFMALWLGLVVGLFGLFLLIQTLILTLKFTDTALEVYRGDTLIRHFPYTDWRHWEIFWSPVPVLFYFREINSIHFLPVLFSPSDLRACLEMHCASAKNLD